MPIVSTQPDLKSAPASWHDLQIKALASNTEPETVIKVYFSIYSHGALTTQFK